MTLKAWSRDEHAATSKRHMLIDALSWWLDSGKKRRLRFAWIGAISLVAACLGMLRMCNGDGDARAMSQIAEVDGHSGDDANQEAATVEARRSLSGMNEVEIPVQSIGFLLEDETGRGESFDDTEGAKASFDIYFMRPRDDGLNGVERIYKSVAATRSLAHESHVVLSVAEEDVPILLMLAQVGEFRLVRSQRTPDRSVQPELRLASRPWVRKLMGDDAVVVVP